MVSVLLGHSKRGNFAPMVPGASCLFYQPWWPLEFAKVIWSGPSCCSPARALLSPCPIGCFLSDWLDAEKKPHRGAASGLKRALVGKGGLLLINIFCCQSALQLGPVAVCFGRIGDVFGFIGGVFLGCLRHLLIPFVRSFRWLSLKIQAQ